MRAYRISVVLSDRSRVDYAHEAEDGFQAAEHALTLVGDRAARRIMVLRVPAFCMASEDGGLRGTLQVSREGWQPPG